VLFKDIRSLGKETLIYGLSTVVARLLNFILLPFYTHYLAPGEYGIITTVFAYIAFFNIVYEYGMDQAYLRFAAGKSEEEAAAIFSTCWLSLAVTSTSLSALVFWNAEALACLGGLRAEAAPLVRYAACVLALDALNAVPFAELRLRHKAWQYVMTRVLNIATNAGANVLLLAGLHLGSRGVFIAALLASSVSLTLLAPVLIARLKPAFDGKLYPELLRFSLPLVPAGLGAMMVQVIDRPVMLRLTDDVTVGIYQANYRMGIFMLLINTMFDQAWRPFFLERAGKPGADALFGRVLTYYLLVGICVVLGLAFFLADIVTFPFFGTPLIHPNYWGGLKVLPVILTAYLFHGAYINFLASITISKRTDLLPWITALGAAVSIGGNFALIPVMGMMGAAWSVFASYAAMACAMGLLGRKVHPIPYEWNRVGKILATGAAAAILALAMRSLHGGTGVYWVLSRLGILTMVPVTLYLVGFFEPDELEVLKRFRMPERS